MRKKTKNRAKKPKPITLELTSVAKEIIEKYGRIDETAPHSLVFSKLANSNSERNLENRIHAAIEEINDGLKSIATELGLRHFTTMTARHTFATLLMNNNISALQIQKSLGHSNVTTTQNYLDSLSSDNLERNKNILENLGK